MAHGLDLGLGGRVGPAVYLGRQLLQERGAGPVGPAGGEHDRGAALVDLADALERLGARAKQRLELGRELRVAERLAAAAVGREHGPELIGRHERGQHQVDEAALVAVAAPMVKPDRRVKREGPVAAAERRVILGQRGELVPHPELGPVPEGGEVPGHSGRVGGEHLAQGRLERGAFGVLVVDRLAPVLEGGDRRGPLVRHHHHVPVVEDGGEDGDGRDDPGHRHVPVAEPELGRAQQLRVDLPPGPDAPAAR